MSFLQLRSRTVNQLTSSTAAVAYVLAAAAGAIVVTGTAANLAEAHILSAAAGSIVVTGTDANLNKGFTVAAASGSYAWTGTAANFAVTMPADPGSVVWTGTAATLSQTSFTPALSVVQKWQRNYPRAFAPAVFGKRRFEFVKTYNVTADPGSYIVTGTDNTFGTTQVGQNINQRDTRKRAWPRPFAPGPWGHFTGTRSLNRLSYATVSYSLIANPGALTVTGTAATLLEGHRLPADPGNFDWNVFAANLNRGRTLTADPAAYSITSVAVNFAVTMPADPGAVVWTGSTVVLNYSGAPTPSGQVPSATRQRWGHRVHYVHRI